MTTHQNRLHGNDENASRSPHATAPSGRRPADQRNEPSRGILPEDHRANQNHQLSWWF